MKTKNLKRFGLTAIALSALALSTPHAYAETSPEASPPPPSAEGPKPDAGSQGGPRSDKFERRGKEMFEKTDTDKDGFLSKDEMEASHRARMEEMFNKTDLDKDGKLSPEELRKGRESMRDKFRQKFKERQGRSGEGPKDDPMDKPSE